MARRKTKRWRPYLRKVDYKAASQYSDRVMKADYQGWDKPTSLYGGFLAGIAYERRRLRKEQK